jgi:hypothetical protein
MKSKVHKLASLLTSLILIAAIGVFVQSLINRFDPGNFSLDFFCAIATLFSMVYALSGRLNKSTDQKVLGWGNQTPWFKPGDKIRFKAGVCRRAELPVCKVTKITQNGFEFSHQPVVIGKEGKSTIVGGETWRPDHFELVQE